MKFHSILYLLRYIDLFQQSISLKIKGKYRVSLEIGRLLSLGIIIFLLYNAINSDLINKTNPIVLQQLLKSGSRPHININQQNFLFAFGASDDYFNHLPDPSFFNLEFGQFSFINGSYLFNKIEVELCDQNYFKNFPGAFEKLKLQNMSCAKNLNTTIKGYWDETEMNYLVVRMKKCVNNSENPICKSEEEITNFFETMYFNVFLLQQNFDLNNFENPFISNIKTIYTGIELGRRKEVSSYLKKTKILTDSQFVFSSYDEKETYVFEEGITDLQKSDDHLLSYCIYPSEYLMVYQRRYEKLFTLLANLGGILNPLIIFCSVFVKYINDWKINEHIMNKIYSIEKNSLKDDEKRSREKEKNEYNKKNFWSLICSKIYELNRFFNPLNQVNLNKKDFQIKNKLKFSFWEKLVYLLKRKKDFNSKESVYHAYMKQSNEKLDLFEIIKKLEEIQRLKIVLFNNKQLKIFNHFYKSIIFTKQNKMNKSVRKFTFDNKLQNINMNRNILEKVRKLNEDKNASQIDRNLLKIIEDSNEINFKKN